MKPLLKIACLLCWLCPLFTVAQTVQVQKLGMHQPTLQDGVVSFIGAGYFDLVSDKPIVAIEFDGQLPGNTRDIYLKLEHTHEGKRVIKNLIHRRNTQGPIRTDLPSVTQLRVGFSFAHAIPCNVKRLSFIFEDGSQTNWVDVFPKDPQQINTPPVTALKRMDTPESQTLSKQAADEKIREQWLEQLGEKPLPQANREELARIERLLERENITPEKREAFRENFEALKKQLPAREKESDYYMDLRALKRAIMFAHNEVDFDEILCIDNPYTYGSEPYHEVRSRTENTAVPGGRLLVLKGLSPDAQVRRLAPDKGAASFWRPDLSYDAQKTLFCMKEENGSNYHLYEMNLDGTGLRQITHAQYNDLDPIYLPDGNIVFSTSRINQYLRCGGSAFREFILARCDPDGKNIYFISTNAEADFLPTLLPDGRIIYCRWEYNDKDVFRVQSLWTVFPDGTNLAIYWGNQSRWPDMTMDAHAIEGTDKVLMLTSGHHDIYAGMPAIISPSEGSNYPDGLYALAKKPWPEVGKGPADKLLNDEFYLPECYVSYYSPKPLGKDLYLVSARTGGIPGLLGDYNPQFFKLFLADYDGNMELVYEGASNIMFAQPVRARKKPDLRMGGTQWQGRQQHPDQQPTPGVLYTADVYANSGVPRGMAKYLRVWELGSQVYCDGMRDSTKQSNYYAEKFDVKQPPFLSGEMTVSLVMDDTHKRMLGTALIEEDGSISIEVPSMRSLYFQLLDERGRTLHSMRSFTHVMPGEMRGCLGCHATQTNAPVTQVSIATRKAPQKLTPPPWGDEETIGFERFVQPILNKNCVSCHNGNEKTPLDFRPIIDETHGISLAYCNLIYSGGHTKTLKELAEKSVTGVIYPRYAYPNPDEKFPTAETIIPPMTAFSYKSKFIDNATSGKHYGVKVSPLEEQRLIAWVDGLCPYFGEEEVRAMPDITQQGWDRRGSSVAGLSYLPRMRTAPLVNRAFLQDDFSVQEDRLPRDENGEIIPPLTFENGKYIRKMPPPKTDEKVPR